MTPFGKRIRELRAERKLTQKTMAKELGVSAAYLSALEKGNRGNPSWEFVQRIIGYFNIIWDDAEELQRLSLASNPKVRVDTKKLPVEATELSNLLAKRISQLSIDDMLAIAHEINVRANRRK